MDSFHYAAWEERDLAERWETGDEVTYAEQGLRTGNISSGSGMFRVLYRATDNCQLGVHTRSLM